MKNNKYKKKSPRNKRRLVKKIEKSITYIINMLSKFPKNKSDYYLKQMKDIIDKIREKNEIRK